LSQYAQLTFGLAGASQSPEPAARILVRAYLDVPTALVAVTLNLYVSPVVSPVTRIPLEESAPVTVPMIPPASDVALYDVITEPLSAGASNQTVIVVSPVEVDLGFNGDEGTLADDIAASATAAVNVNVTAGLVCVT
jgi:hypothetical protein